MRHKTESKHTMKINEEGRIDNETKERKTNRQIDKQTMKDKHKMRLKTNRQ